VVKQRFLLDPSLVFLNHGAFGACPAEVFAAYQAWQHELERNPVEFLGRRSAALLCEARKALAGFIGTHADDLIFIPNATTGINIAAQSLALDAGDEVLTTDQEYGACDNAWRHVCNARGAIYRAVPIALPFAPDDFVDHLWAGVHARTRAIHVSHVTSSTALILPIAQLCARARAAGIITVIDGAHAPGQIELDLDALGADFYVGNCHKWLCAPKGAAFLYARPEHHARLEAPVVSWGYSAEVLGHAGFDAYTGSTLIERRLQWQGTRELAAFLSVPAAIRFHQTYLTPRVRRACHLLALATRERIDLCTGLDPLCGPDDFAQMAAIAVPPTDAEALRRALFERYRIEVSVTRHGAQVYVRLSVQAYNTQGDVDRFVAAIVEVLGHDPAQRGRPKR